MTTETWEGEEYETDLTTIFKQCSTDSDNWFGEEVSHSLAHHVLALCGESGELANLVKKVQRGSLEMNAETRFKMVMEATDVFIYVMNIFACLQYHPAYAYKVKTEENHARFDRPDGGVRTAPPESMDQGGNGIRG